MRRARAFTLLELLIAVALLFALSGAIFAFVRDLNTQRQAIGDRGRTTLRGAALFDHIERSLLTSVAEHEGVAGIVGDAESITVTSRSGGGVGGAVRATFSHEPGAAEIVASSDAWPRSVLVEGVRRLRLRYLVGGQWRGRFDSMEQGGLPEAVEVALWFGGVDAEAVLAELAEDDAAGLGIGGVPDDMLLPPMDMPGGDAFEMDMGFDDDLGPPDRRRVIAVPDASDAGWERFAAGAN